MVPGYLLLPMFCTRPAKLLKKNGQWKVFKCLVFVQEYINTTNNGSDMKCQSVNTDFCSIENQLEGESKIKVGLNESLR